MLQRLSINRRWAIERDQPQATFSFNAHQNGARFVLMDHDGHFVESVDTADQATRKFDFTFTSEPEKAFVFSYADLYDKNATNAIGTEFARGYCGRAIRIDLGATT